MTHIEVFKAATSVGAEGVLTANIKNEAITEAKIAAQAVGAGNVFRPIQPATPAGEGEVATASVGVARKSITIVTGKAAQTKYKIKHLLNNTGVLVQVLKVTAKVPTGPYLEAAGAGNYTWTILSATEVEVTFGSELKAGEEAVIVVIA